MKTIFTLFKITILKTEKHNMILVKNLTNKIDIEHSQEVAL